MAPIRAARAPRFVHFSTFSYCSSDVISNSAAWRDPTTSQTADWERSDGMTMPESDFQSWHHDGGQACADQPHQFADRPGNRCVAKGVPRQWQHLTKDRGSPSASRSRYRRRALPRGRKHHICLMAKIVSLAKIAVQRRLHCRIFVPDGAVSQVDAVPAQLR
jgi:hypothetical protein